MAKMPAAYPQQGYECEFTEPLPSAFQTKCLICQQILRNPYETDCCGDVFCYSCISQAQGNSSCCPSCKSEEYHLLHRKSLERSLKNLHVWCESHKDGCKWTGELGQYDSHLNLNSKLEERMDGCEYAKVQCHNGCGMLIPRCQILLHEMEECSQKRDDHTELERSLHFYIQKLKQEISQKDKRIAELEADSMTSQKEVHPATPDPEESATIVPVQRTMPNFAEMKKFNKDYVSKPFYTHPGGYKMCLWVWPNGFDSAENTHVSLFTCFMMGENDDMLKWPFRGNITVQLVNQAQNCHHRKRVLRYDDNNPLYGKRLTSGDKSEGLGYRKLVAHESLYQTTCQYLKDDCLKFRITKVELGTPE